MKKITLERVLYSRIELAKLLRQAWTAVNDLHSSNLGSKSFNMAMAKRKSTWKNFEMKLN